MRKFLFLSTFAFATMLIFVNPSHAVEIDFSVGTPGNLNDDTFTDPGTGLVVQGLYFNGVDWAPANLYRRNEPNDHGFGVCNPVEAGATDCPGPSGGGDVNELDNAGQNELITLELPPGYRWVSVQISSMDTNDSGPVPERGVLYSDNDGVFNITFGAVGDTVIDTFTGGVDPVEAVIPIGAAFAQSSFLVFEPFDHSAGGTNTNNDFLVFKAVIEPIDGQGCTPGYWKQPHHFDSWNVYSPGDDFDTVFGVVSTFEADTLIEVLEQGGGKENALGRHAVAALLNSVSPGVDYFYTTAQVIAIVQEAYATGKFGKAKNLLEDQNESGCPLN